MDVLNSIVAKIINDVINDNPITINKKNQLLVTNGSYWRDLINRLNTYYSREERVKELLFTNQKYFDFWSKYLNSYDWEILILNLKPDVEVDVDIKKLLFTNKEYIEIWTSKLNTNDWLYILENLKKSTQADIEFANILFSDKEIFKLWSNKMNANNWYLFIINDNMGVDVDELIKEPLFSNKEIFKIWSQNMNGEDWMNTIFRIEPNNNVNANIKKILFTDIELFDIWSKTMTGNGWMNLIIRLELDNSTDAYIKKLIFTDKEYFDKWYKTLNSKDWMSLIIRLYSDKELDAEIKKLMFSDKEYFAKWSIAVAGDEWRIIINNLNINNPVDAEVKKILFTDKELFNIWSKAISEKEWNRIFFNLDLSDPTDREIKKVLFTDKNCYDKWLKNININELLDAISAYSETDCAIAYNFLNDKEVFEILSQIINKDDWNKLIYKFDPNDSQMYLSIYIYKQKISKMLKLKIKGQKYILKDERKKELLTDDSRLEKFLINEYNYNEDLLNTILILDSSKELDFKLKKKILTEEKYIKLILNNKKLGANFLVNIIKYLSPSKEDIAIKKEILLNEKNLNLIVNSLQKNTHTLIECLCGGIPEDAEIKKELLLNEKYYSIINKKDHLYSYMSLSSNNDGDRKIKEEFFLNEKYLPVINKYLNDNVLWEYIILLNVNNELDAKIKEKLFLDAKYLPITKNNISSKNFLNLLLRLIENAQELDKKILCEIYLDTKVLKKGIEKLGVKQIKELLTILSYQKEIVKKIKSKIFTSDEILPIMLNKMDNYDMQEFIKKLDYSLKDNSIIIVKMLFNPSNLNIIVKKINILDLLVQDNKDEQLYIIEKLLITKELEQILIDAYGLETIIKLLISKPIIARSLDNYKKLILLDETYTNLIKPAQTGEIIKYLLDPTNPEDIKNALSILKSKNEKPIIYNLYVCEIIKLGLSITNKENELYKVVINDLSTTDSIDIIVSNSSIKEILEILNKLDIFNEQERLIITKIIGNKIFIEGIKRAVYDEQLDFYNFYKKVTNEIQKRNESVPVYDEINIIMSELKAQSYSRKKIKKIWSPQGSGTVYKFHRGSFVISPKGDQITADFDRSKAEIIIEGKQVRNNYRWDHHAQGIRESLRAFGQPNEELSAIEDHPFPYSIYGRDNGYLIIMIEGDQMQIYFPDDMTIEQFMVLQRDLSSIEEYEKRNDTRMEMKLLVSDNEIDEILGHPVYTGDVGDIIEEEGLVKNPLNNKQ